MKEVALIGMLLLGGAKITQEVDSPKVQGIAQSVPNKDSAIAVELYKAQQNYKKLKLANETPKK